MNKSCTICGHLLIDHGEYPDVDCDCCSGRSWSTNPEAIKAINLDISASNKKLPKGFRVCKDYPDYMVNRQGAVRHIDTGQACKFLHLTRTGKSYIRIYKDGVSAGTTAEYLRRKAFEPISSTQIDEILDKLVKSEGEK